LRYAVQKGGGAPPRRTVQDGCHGKSTSISLSRGHPFAKIGGAYIATAMRSLLCGGCHAKSSCRHRAGCTLAEYVAPCISRWPTVRHGQPHKGAGCTTWAPISARASLAGDGGDNSRSVRWYPAIKKASETTRQELNEKRRLRRAKKVLGAEAKGCANGGSTCGHASFCTKRTASRSRRKCWKRQ
jgi:hypothetical protein